MSDAADIANDANQAGIDSVLANRTRYEGESAIICRDCGDKIYEARRQLVPGCQRCRDCEEMADQRKRK